MLKFQISIFYGVILIFLSSQVLNAQENGNGNGGGAFTATTVIGQDMLNFGTFTSGTGPGEISVDPNGDYNPPPSGGIQVLPFGQPPSAVTFAVNTPNNSKLVTITPTTTLLTGPGGNLRLDLIFNPNSFITNGSQTLIKMGGKLYIPEGITEGNYSGNLVITFSYN